MKSGKGKEASSVALRGSAGARANLSGPLHRFTRPAFQLPSPIHTLFSAHYEPRFPEAGSAVHAWRRMPGQGELGHWPPWPNPVDPPVGG
eukprot:1159429-Pelagomonas_calceolata.AAC.2